ncbi:SMP-30/gluconolaconase/LRE-like region [mine drainage metagenome]|uniref:SMP-30/gluconolaconase/LRE-like region n=1 Tax=mine drainage metagenome TaxID=410659 RepID=A0A1J5R889_9ZZZZ
MIIHYPSEPDTTGSRKRSPSRGTSIIRTSLAPFIVVLGLGLMCITPAGAEPKGLLETIHRHKMLASTIPENGDVNPYAVIVAPVSMGSIEKDDVLVDNFNNISNLQGTGTTIIRYRPSTRETRLFAQVAQNLKDCPGGVGLTTAMTMLKSGWVIAGSTPSSDGTTRTKGDGCLLVFDPDGRHVATWTGPAINGPWGNMVTVDHGDHATLFISMAGFGVPGPEILDPATHYPVAVHEATVLRLELTIPEGRPPVLRSQTVVGNGFAQRADRDNFLLGPTGLALGPDDTLYVTDGLDNEITAIQNASTRTDSAGKGTVLTRDGLLAWPLAMVMTAVGHLIVCNGKNGQAVEIDPASGKQIYAQWLDSNQAQSPPGNGDLFGIALTPDGKGIYYVEDDVNALVLGAP